MNNMRHGFTMIELIFVIVIIGILAAIAVPRLAATRDDAVVSKEISNARTCLSDAKAEYTATGSIKGLADENTVGYSRACFESKDASQVKATVNEKTLQVTIVDAPASVNLNGVYDINASSVKYDANASK